MKIRIVLIMVICLCVARITSAEELSPTEKHIRETAGRIYSAFGQLELNFEENIQKHCEKESSPRECMLINNYAMKKLVRIGKELALRIYDDPSGTSKENLALNLLTKTISKNMSDDGDMKYVNWTSALRDFEEILREMKLPKSEV